MRRMRLTKRWLVLALTGITACNPFRDSIHDTLYGSDTDSSYKTKDGESTTYTSSSSSTTTTTTVTRRSNDRQQDFLQQEAQLQAAEDGLRAVPALSGKQVYLYDAVHFYDDGRIMLSVQNPGNPEYIDKYDFEDGAWKGPEPVQLSVHDNIKIALVKLEAMPFKNVAVVYRNYRAKSDSVLGTTPPNHIYAIIRNNQVVWYPRSISGSRERYFISFHPDGSLDRYYRE